MKQDLRVAVTKRMIQEALIRLLKNKPIDKIKVNELCEESGINRATFYRHYETLQDILREIEADVIRAMPQPRQKPRTLEDARAYLKQVCTYIYDKMLIDLTQHATRCSDSSGQAQEYLIARHAAVETETVLVQICLELGAPSVICSLKECFQITDCLVYPMQIICFVFLCVQFHTFQIQVASVTVAFYLRFRHKILVDDFLQSLSLYVIYCLHPGKQWCTVCGFGYGHHNLGLIRTTTSFAVMGRSANIAVIQLYNAGKQVFFVSLTHSGTNSIQ